MRTSFLSMIRHLLCSFQDFNVLMFMFTSFLGRFMHYHLLSDAITHLHFIQHHLWRSSFAMILLLFFLKLNNIFPVSLPSLSNTSITDSAQYTNFTVVSCLSIIHCQVELYSSHFRSDQYLMLFLWFNQSLFFAWVNRSGFYKLISLESVVHKTISSILCLFNVSFFCFWLLPCVQFIIFLLSFACAISFRKLFHFGSASFFLLRLLACSFIRCLVASILRKEKFINTYLLELFAKISLFLFFGNPDSFCSIFSDIRLLICAADWNC